MARRRSHSPRARKGRNADTEAPRQQDIAVAPSHDPVAELVRETAPAPAPLDELAALDAGWDDV